MPNLAEAGAPPKAGTQFDKGTAYIGQKTTAAGGAIAGAGSAAKRKASAAAKSASTGMSNLNTKATAGARNLGTQAKTGLKNTWSKTKKLGSSASAQITGARVSGQDKKIAAAKKEQAKLQTAKGLATTPEAKAAIQRKIDAQEKTARMAAMKKGDLEAYKRNTESEIQRRTEKQQTRSSRSVAKREDRTANAQAEVNRRNNAAYPSNTSGSTVTAAAGAGLVAGGVAVPGASDAAKAPPPQTGTSF